MRKNIRAYFVFVGMAAMMEGCGHNAVTETNAAITATKTVAETEIETTDVIIEGVVNIELSGEGITVDGEKIANVEDAVYAANDIIYYEEGKDFKYGEGTEAVVTLILNGVDITSTVAPAILVYNVYEYGPTDEEAAGKNVDTTMAGMNLVIAEGCSFSMDAGIDSDNGIHINGGTVIATGNKVVSYAPENSFTYLIISDTDMKDGTYILCAGDTQLLGAEGKGMGDFREFRVILDQVTSNRKRFRKV